MDEMKKTDKPFLILHQPASSIGDIAFVGDEEIAWLVYGLRKMNSLGRFDNLARGSILWNP